MKNKFRVWCKNRNEWERNETYIDQNGDLWCWQSNRLITVRKETHTIEQCTGFKDKDGNLIYEGDILQVSFFYDSSGLYGACESDANFIGEVYFDKKLASFAFKNIKEFRIDGLLNYDNADGMLFSAIPACHEQERYSILGNIHENPELLEETKA